MNRAGLVAVLALGVAGVGMAAGVAGPVEGFGGPPVAQESEGPEYNGQYAYVRLRYGESGSDLRNAPSMSYGRRGRGRGGGAPWAHDWPRAETNFSKILEATTFIDVYTEGYSGRILTLADPELFKYPVATIIEVGNWRPSDEEVANLREYLLKGGFLIVDDTRDERGYEFQNFYSHMRRALPEYEIQLVPDDHPVFNSFFNIEDPGSLAPPYGRYAATYLGIFEDNDPIDGRLMVMINWNQDLQEYWEFSDQGYYPIDLSNEAYKFGVNYMIYSFTH